jgi:hypothetical protein
MESAELLNVLERVGVEMAMVPEPIVKEVAAAIYGELLYADARFQPNALVEVTGELLAVTPKTIVRGSAIDYPRTRRAGGRPATFAVSVISLGEVLGLGASYQVMAGDPAVEDPAMQSVSMTLRDGASLTFPMEKFRPVDQEEPLRVLFNQLQNLRREPSVG